MRPCIVRTLEEVITLYNTCTYVCFVDLYNIRRYHFAICNFHEELVFCVTCVKYVPLYDGSRFPVYVCICVHIGLCCVVVESTDLMWLLHTVAVLVWPI